MPGVPVYLWWKDIPHDSDLLFDRLTRMADRVVIDSAKFDHPTATDLLRLARLIGDPTSTHARQRSQLGTAHRVAHAAREPVGRAGLPSPARPRRPPGLVYRPLPNGQRAMAPRPLMLAGWLASRLGWEVVEAMPHDDRETASWRLRADDRDIVARRFAATRRARWPTRGSRRVALSTSDGAGGFFAALAPDNSRITTEARIGTARSLGARASPTRRATMPIASRASSTILRHDTVYEAAMLRAGQLIESCPQLCCDRSGRLMRFASGARAARSPRPARRPSATAATRRASRCARTSGTLVVIDCGTGAHGLSQALMTKRRAASAARPRPHQPHPLGPHPGPALLRAAVRARQRMGHLRAARLRAVAAGDARRADAVHLFPGRARTISARTSATTSSSRARSRSATSASRRSSSTIPR